ncbi:hypothetical protein O4J55_12890 [Paracoccus sp. PXZ]|nr:hypothetical protein [Paracoccus pantotrophus]
MITSYSREGARQNYGYFSRSSLENHPLIGARENLPGNEPIG